MIHTGSTDARRQTGRLRVLRRLGVTVCLVLALGLTLGIESALGMGEGATPDGGRVVLTVGWLNSPDSLNPFVGTATSAYEVWLLNYDMLVGAGQDLQPAPELATSWATSPDGLVWTFTLRQDATWNDGQPLTAEDVAFTYNYIIDNDITQFGTFTNGIDKVVAIDSSTVKFQCSAPKANMLRMWIPILPRHVWSKVKPSKAQAGYVMKPPIVGSGPFVVTEFAKDDYVKLEANPTFWGEKPAIDEILFVAYQNADTMTQDLVSGTLDAAWGVPSAQFAKLSSGDPDITGIAYSLLNWEYLCLNSYVPPKGGASRGNPALRDPVFRTAISRAIDKQRIVDLAWGGRGEPGTTIMTPHTWVDPDYHWEPPASEAHSFDPAEARASLEAAGYRDVNGDGLRETKDGKPLTLRLWANTESPESQLEGRLIAGWLKDVGLKIEYSAVDNSIYYDRVWGYQGDTFSPDFDMYIWSWDSYSDPGDTLACFATDEIENWNEPGWSNAEFDQLVAAQATELDPQKRKELVWQAQQVMNSSLPEIVLCYPRYLEMVNTAELDGWTRMYGGEGAASGPATSVAAT